VQPLQVLFFLLKPSFKSFFLDFAEVPQLHQLILMLSLNVTHVHLVMPFQFLDFILVLLSSLKQSVLVLFRKPILERLKIIALSS